MHSRVHVACLALCSLLQLSTALAQDKPPVPALSAEEAAGRPMPELRLNPQTLATLDEPVKRVKIEAGTISRAKLQAELERGIGAFLGHVRMKPAMEKGRFLGWRVLELFRKRPDVRVLGLKPGDTVVRVNGRSLERPEQLKLVWDGLPAASELLIEIERDGRRCELRYAIV
jgi:hypothetical protein